ncbi:hypothetical protein [Mesorhizobium sp.]|uniref:head-tail connector protein n=1 Tax=Mesorhizobium sp. TaxID=1871066 RepID=UPI0025F2ACE4|nr:hypothetical protein [Mesorhizobium sp.]
MRLVLVTAPSAEPLTAAEAKARLGIGAEVSDDVMNAFIKAARQTIDGWSGWLGRALVRQTWKMILDRFPSDCGGEITIPLPPTLDIAEIKYFDVDGAEQTIEAPGYFLLPGEPGRLYPAIGSTWPHTKRQPGAVEISFIAGFGAAGSDVPEPIRNAIVLMVSNLRSLSARNLFISQDTVDGVGSKQYIVGGNAGAAIDAAVASLLSTYRVFA